MKKIIAITAVLAVAGMAQASLINLQGNFAFGTGAGVYEYVDADTDSAGLFTTGFTAYVFNSAIFDALIQDGMSTQDLATVVGSAIVSSPVGLKTAGVGQYTRIEPIANIVVPDGTFVYTLLVNDTASAGLPGWAMILDNDPVNVGAFDPGVSYTPTQLIPAVNSTIGMDGKDWLAVVPEPATIGLMGIAGLGLFLARKKTV